MLGPQPEGGSHPQWRGPSLQVIVKYQKEMCYSFSSKASRCSIQQGMGLREPIFFLYVHSCLCLWYHAFSTAIHPSFPFAVRGSGITAYCFYSISCHYQQQFDYGVHLAGGEQ